MGGKRNGGILRIRAGKRNVSQILIAPLLQQRDDTVSRMMRRCTRIGNHLVLADHRGRVLIESGNSCDGSTSHSDISADGAVGLSPASYIGVGVPVRARFIPGFP